MSTILLLFNAKNEPDLQKQIKKMKNIAKSYNLQYHNPEGIEAQVFKTSKGIVYRILECGYGLRNRLWKDPETFPQEYSYDGRSMEYDQELEDFGEEIDKLIKSENYDIFWITLAKNNGED